MLKLIEAKYHENKNIKNKIEIVDNLHKHFEKMGYTKKWEQG